ncbi:MAG: MBL fold metallo-hydrolase [Cetobacterium sp.]
MVKLTALSSKDYENSEKNYGDCFIIHKGESVIVYDCGSDEHAERVCKYIENKKIKNVDIVLSHNDTDHFSGIKYLTDNVNVRYIYTLLLFKYKKELLELIGDNRKTERSLIENIKDYYDNIYKLGDTDTELRDVITYMKEEIMEGVKIFAPDKEYTLNAIAKALDSREGNTINNETIVNAVSTQVVINDKVLLCGDSCYDALKDNIDKFDYIQLPHHGKKDQGLKIFEANKKRNHVIYLISDNTGNTNGGSDKLDTKGKYVKNTKDGDIEIPNLNEVRISVGSWGRL